MSRAPVPSSGDVVWVTLYPSVGREQTGRRPFLVLSPQRYNARASLIVGCPITSRPKGYRFEIPIAAGEIVGYVLADQVKSIDWRLRKATLAARADTATQRRVIMHVAALIGVKPAA